MTREENLHWIDQEIKTWENECQSKHPIKEALYAARKELEQEPCEDAVSRKSVIAIIQNHWWNCRDIDKLVNQLPPVTPQEPNTWSLDDAREDFMHDVYNELDFLPTNEEANRIIDIFDRVTSSIEQAPRWIPVTERLPDNATNGDMIKAVFPNVQVVDAGIHRITAIFGDCHNMMYRNSYDEDWWNAPYKGGQGNGNDD